MCRFTHSRIKSFPCQADKLFLVVLFFQYDSMNFNEQKHSVMTSHFGIPFVEIFRLRVFKAEDNNTLSRSRLPAARVPENNKVFQFDEF